MFNNEMLKATIIIIVTQMNYLFANRFVLKRQAKIIDKRISILFYNFKIEHLCTTQFWQIRNSRVTDYNLYALNNEMYYTTEVVIEIALS
jgi:hypothetical protein